MSAQIILMVLAAYTAAGVLFAVFFVIIGAGRIDPVVNRSTWGFRLLIFPGSAALWPLLLVKWLKAGSPAKAEGQQP